MSGRAIVYQIIFNDERVAKSFISWLDGQGEQDFPEWLENQTGIRSVTFGYNTVMGIITVTHTDDVEDTQEDLSIEDTA